MSHRNPFIYGRPVKGSECLRRERQLQTVFNRLRNGESTAIVGEPRIGKTSFLLQLADPIIQKEFLDDTDKKIIVAYLNLQTIESNYSIENFWTDVLAPLEYLNNKGAYIQIPKIKSGQLTRRFLGQLLTKLAEQNYLLVLLLDEFELILNHPNFKDPAFFGLLRNLCTLSESFAYVITSRQPLAELNRLGQKLLNSGSPFFNNMIEVTLPPFNDEEIEILLSKANYVFSTEEKFFIRRVAGRNPFLLQAVAANLHEEMPSPCRAEKAAELFYQQTTHHFIDVWNYLDDQSRTIVVILSLQAIGGHTLGTGLDMRKIEPVDMYGMELGKLVGRGLAELVENSSSGWNFAGQNLLRWRGKRWGIGCAALSWWVRDNTMASSYANINYSEWLRQKHYIGFLSEEQWDGIITLIKKSPAQLLHGVGGLAKLLWNEIAGNK